MTSVGDDVPALVVEGERKRSERTFLMVGVDKSLDAVVFGLVVGDGEDSKSADDADGSPPSL